MNNNKITVKFKHDFIRFLCEEITTNRTKEFVRIITNYTDSFARKEPLGIVVDNADYIDTKNIFMNIKNYFNRNFPDGEDRLFKLCVNFIKN